MRAYQWGNGRWWLSLFYIMDDNLKLFENPDFGDVRVLLDEKHEPWFVGNDVAKCLGYADPRDAVRRLVDDEDCKMLRLSEDRDTYDSTLFTINMLAR